MFGKGASSLIGSLQSSLDVSKFFGSSIDLLIGSSSSIGVDASSEFREKVSFLPVLPGRVAAAASDADFNGSTVFFSSSIDSPIGSFWVDCACFFSFFFFFFLGAEYVSESDSEDESESDESRSKGSELFCSVCISAMCVKARWTSSRESTLLPDFPLKVVMFGC